MAVFLMKEDKGWFIICKLSYLILSILDLKLFDTLEDTSTTASNPIAQGKEYKKILFLLKCKCNSFFELQAMLEILRKIKRLEQLTSGVHFSVSVLI